MRSRTFLFFSGVCPHLLCPEWQRSPRVPRAPTGFCKCPGAVPAEGGTDARAVCWVAVCRCVYFV